MSVRASRSRSVVKAVLLAMTCVALAGAGAVGDSGRPEQKPGGDTTVFADGRNAFSFPAANLNDGERTRFAIGNSFFRRNWVEAPSSTGARDGLGPHFIARSCGGCHFQDGRGSPPQMVDGVHDQPVGLLIRLSVPGSSSRGGPKPEPSYGDQFNNFAIRGVKPEGKVVITHQTLAGSFSDGTRYELLKPLYGFSDLGYGAMSPDVMISPRVAPQLIGVGLLEAIPDAEILRNAQEQAASGGPVHGKPNIVWDAPTEKMRIGRFGWKANVATLAHQTAGAFLGDMGITSSIFPDEACMPVQQDCREAASGGKGGSGEIDDALFSDVVFYQATLAPPARPGADDQRVQQGKQLFEQANCAACHRPSYVTAEGPIARHTSAALSGQRIWPYTDLLLHDMGEALADGRADFEANGRQWKTPPLWGIGMIPAVNGHQQLLHDGRARGVIEAILWHGGEAEDSKARVLRMSIDEREALVRFVESL